MIAHGEAELVALANVCQILDRPPVNGWTADELTLDRDALNLAAEAYKAVLLGGSDDIAELLGESGIDLESLLITPDSTRDDITRSDLCELIAAASVIADGTCQPSTMIMPNIPKMSRRKSDSGIDIMSVSLVNGATTTELTSQEILTLVSVKHTVQANTYNMHHALLNSVSTSELSKSYLANQLRVISARLCESGWDAFSIKRIYLFLSEASASASIFIKAVGLADLSAKADFESRIKSSAPPEFPNSHIRAIYISGINQVQELCV